MIRTGMKACPCCGSGLEHPGWGPAALRRCAGCGSAFLPAKAGSAAEDYGSDYFTGQGPGGVDYEDSRRQFRLINRGRLEWMARFAPRGGRLFELGCALGFFLEDAAQFGWQGYGVELSGFAAGKARLRLGSRVRRGTLKQVPGAWKAFDGACAFHVLEHLDDPAGSLAKMGSLLKPGALLALELPDFSSRAAREGRERWKYFLPGEHLGYYTRQGLERLLDRAGFEVLDWRSTSFTRLLGAVERAGLRGLRELVLRNLRWLGWIKALVLGLRGAMGGHDCVLLVARKRALPGPVLEHAGGDYTLFTGPREYLRLYRFHRQGTEGFAAQAAMEARALAGFLEARFRRPLRDIRILEIGCGQRAQGTLALHSLGAQVTGIDLEPAGPGWRKYAAILRMGSLARFFKTAARELLFDGAYYRALSRRLGVPLRYKGLRVMQASATRLPFGEGSFDAVVSRAVFEHLPDLPAALDELNRVLAPGGVARILIHLYPSLSGGHHLEWQDPSATSRRSVPAWDHLLEDRHPAPVYLNRLRKSDYLRAFRGRMRLLRSWTTLEGAQHLTPAIQAAARRKGYLRRELLERELGLLAAPRKG